MAKVYLQTPPGTIVFLVFASEREKYNDNVVVKCKVKEATITEGSIIYFCEPIKVVTKVGDKNIKNWISTFMFEHANIDTGLRRKPNRYPVFTTKEKCLEWIKG